MGMGIRADKAGGGCDGRRERELERQDGIHLPHEGPSAGADPPLPPLSSPRGAAAAAPPSWPLPPSRSPRARPPRGRRPPGASLLFRHALKQQQETASGRSGEGSEAASPKAEGRGVSGYAVDSRGGSGYTVDSRQ